MKGLWYVLGVALLVGVGYALYKQREGFTGFIQKKNNKKSVNLASFEPPQYQDLNENNKELTETGDFVFDVFQVLKASRSCYMNHPDPLRNDIYGIATLDKYQHSRTKEETCILTVGSNSFDVQTDIKEPNGKYKVSLKNKEGKSLGDRQFDMKLVSCSSGAIPCQTIQGPPNVKLHTIIPKELSNELQRHRVICLYYQGEEIMRGKC